MEQMFRDTGLSHITVFSGTNVLLFIAALWFLTARLGFTLRVCIQLLGIVIVVFAAGLGAPAVRAGIMAAVVTVSKLFGTQVPAKETLAAAVALMVFHNGDLLLHDVSFQLSVLATLALVTLAVPLQNYCARVPFLIKEVLAITVAVLLVVSPWVAYVFGTVSVSALCANILVSFIIAPATFFTLCAALVGSVLPQLALLTALPAEVSLNAIIAVAEFMAALPYSSIEIPPFHGGILLVYYLALCLWYARAARATVPLVEK
jgi:competence protein ComEC